MRTIIYAIAIFFLSFIIYGQDYESLKKSDTIYIEFKGNKNERKYLAPNQSINFVDRGYHFVDHDKLDFYFICPSYKKRGKENTNIVSGLRKENMSFLKTHKKDIIDEDFLKRYEKEEIICNIITRLKVLYIIDLTEKKKGNVTLYDVSCLNYCPSIE